MSADTFVSALFIITAVVAAGILINAVYPIVWSSASTFSSSAHDTDTRMRTDFKIVTTYARSSDGIGKIWMKNIGSNRLGIEEIEQSDVFFGPQGSFSRMDRQIPNPNPHTDPPVGQGKWNYILSDSNSNNYWDTGETLEIDASSMDVFASGDYVYFQFVLSNGVLRSTQFTAI